MEYESRIDADNAIKELQGQDFLGDPLVIEWSKREKSIKSDKREKSNSCFKRGRDGHWARDCRENIRDRRPPSRDRYRERER